MPELRQAGGIFFGAQRIADRVAIVTDEDPVAANDSERSSGAERRKALIALAKTAGAPDALLIELSPITLEASLAP